MATAGTMTVEVKLDGPKVVWPVILDGKETGGTVEMPLEEFMQRLGLKVSPSTSGNGYTSQPKT